MKYCSVCGNELVDEAVVCTNCGCAVANTLSVDVNDAPSMGFAVLGFFIPIIGLILYLVYKNTYPLKARSAGKGALISVCIALAIPVIFLIATLLISVILILVSASHTMPVPAH